MVNSNFKKYNNIELVSKFVDLQRKSNEGYITDFLGSRTNVNHYDTLTSRSGEVCNFPNPSDTFLHDFIEYVGSCYAYENLTNEHFTAIELGAGNGVWTVRSGLVALRQKVKNINLCAVEASQEKINFIKQNINDNLIVSNENSKVNVEIINAAVSVDENELSFPIIEDPSHDYGASVTGGRSGIVDYRGHHQEFIKIKAVPLNLLIEKFAEIDLIHIDIQGAEFNVLESAIKQLNSKVKVIVIGTHSRLIEGELLQLFFENKWELYCEQQVEFMFNSSIPSLEGMTTRDGGQVWINTTL